VCGARFPRKAQLGDPLPADCDQRDVIISLGPHRSSHREKSVCLGWIREQPREFGHKAVPWASGFNSPHIDKTTELSKRNKIRSAKDVRIHWEFCREENNSLYEWHPLSTCGYCLEQEYDLVRRIFVERESHTLCRPTSFSSGKRKVPLRMPWNFHSAGFRIHWWRKQVQFEGGSDILLCRAGKSHERADGPHLQLGAHLSNQHCKIRKRNCEGERRES